MQFLRAYLQNSLFSIRSGWHVTGLNWIEQHEVNTVAQCALLCSETSCMWFTYNNVTLECNWGSDYATEIYQRIHIGKEHG